MSQRLSAMATGTVPPVAGWTKAAVVVVYALIPDAPVAPWAPVGPAGPVGPVPLAPVGPAGRVGPVAPPGPVGPVGPVTPSTSFHVAPVQVISWPRDVSQKRYPSRTKNPEGLWVVVPDGILTIPLTGTLVPCVRLTKDVASYLATMPPDRALLVTDESFQASTTPMPLDAPGAEMTTFVPSPMTAP